MKIAISGLVGTGKTTAALEVRKILDSKGKNAEVIIPTFKDIAKEMGISLMDYQRMAENDPTIDKLFDKRTEEMASKPENAIVASWLAMWIIKDADLRVFLYAPLNTRAERISQRDGIGVEDAKRHIVEREEGNRKRYMSLYGIDILDYTIADVCINALQYDAEKVAEMIVSALEIKERL
jgi:cytidylate kinase